MFITDIKRVIDQVSREKGIDAEILITTIKEAIVSAARKKIGPRADIEVHYDEKSGDVEVFHFKEVVETVEYADSELTLEEGYEYDSECLEWEFIEIKNGYHLNCYPDGVITKNLEILIKLKELLNSNQMIL